MCDNAFTSLWHSDAIWWHRSMAPSHHLNQCWLLMTSCGIHIRPISQEMLKISFLDMNRKNIHPRLQPHLTGTNGLNVYTVIFIQSTWDHLCIPYMCPHFIATVRITKDFYIPMNYSNNYLSIVICNVCLLVYFIFRGSELGISIRKERRSCDRLIFTVGIKY